MVVGGRLERYCCCCEHTLVIHHQILICTWGSIQRGIFSEARVTFQRRSVFLVERGLGSRG